MGCAGGRGPMVGFRRRSRQRPAGSWYVLPVSEILPFRGVDFVGTIPAELPFVQVFSAAVVKGTENPEASKRLIEFLASEKATPTVEKTGMKRPKS
jgi:ABC-type molybdate transport system substrate-binding protein